MSYCEPALMLYMHSWKNQPHQATRGQSIFDIKENWQPSTTMSCIENFTACIIMYIVVHESIKQVDLYAIFFIHIKTRTEKCYSIVLCNYIIITEINLLYQAIANMYISASVCIIQFIIGNNSLMKVTALH